MTFDPLQRMPLRRTGLTVTRLGFGAAEIGGLYRAVSDEAATAVVEHAWDIGVRYFDVAPLYGSGLAETRLGSVLQQHPRDSFVLSTKVGRLLVDDGGANEPGPEMFEGAPPRRPVFDFSRDGVLRSIEESLGRLGLSRLDIVYLHDPDDHWDEAISLAYPALEALRREGVIGAIGVGMNQAGMLARFASEGDFDVMMCAGRYTLLDQAALDDLLPTCSERGVAVVIAGVMNSGILANPVSTARFDYHPASPERLDQARKIEAVCRRFGVPLKAAAIQFPLAHPATTCLVAGVRSADHLGDYPRSMELAIPRELWAALIDEGLLRADAPVPGS